VTTTASISAAASRASATRTQSASSSAADFLLANSQKGADSFRAVADAFFASPDLTPTKAQSLTKTTGGDDRQTRKPGDTSDPAALHPELMVPVLNLPVQWIQVAAKAEEATTHGLRATGTLVDDATKLTSQAQIKDGDVAMKAAVDVAIPENTELPQGPGKTLGTSGANEHIATAIAAGKQSLASPVIKNDVKQKKTTSAGNMPQPGVDATGKKASELTRPAIIPLQTTATGVQKQIPAPPANIEKPAAPADTKGAPNHSEQQTSATTSVPVAPLADSTSPSSLRAMVESSITSKVAAQAGSAASRVIGDIKKTGAKSAPSKEKEQRDVVAPASQNGKATQPSAASTAIRPVTPSASGSKDITNLTAAAHSATHSRQEAVKPAGGTPSSAASMTDADGPDEAVPTTASSPITAKFVAGMSQSEFRVGMQTQEFGNIDIRTSVARHMFSAQISVEHSDMAKSLTAELPTLYSKLADQHVPVANIVIQGQSLATSSGLAQDAQPRNWQPQNQHFSRTTAEVMLPTVIQTIDSGGRLDIRI
jgi:flagellar hook-length control protein FliK